MGTVNLRAKIDPSVFSELRTSWNNRCTQVEARKASEKEIDKANKDIIKKMTESLKDRVYLKNAKLRIRDTDVLLEKFYSIRDLRTNGLSYFSVCTLLPSMAMLFRDDKSSKDIPKIIERKARTLDRLTKRAMKHHGVCETVTLFQIILETQTKYSF